MTTELKCCRICGAFLTCTRKGECCPECQYFDDADVLCLAPDALKKKAKQAKVVVVEKVIEDDDVDPETFLFEDDDEDEDSTIESSDDLDSDDFEIEDVEW